MIALLLCGIGLIQSCSKEEGPVGPQGPTGLTGATGATGQNGVSGAKVFTFTNQINGVFGSMAIDSSFVDSSAVLVYYQDAVNGTANIWYQAPGLGAIAAYQTRYYIDIRNATTTDLYLSLYNLDGSAYLGASVTFTKVKVVFIPYGLTGKKEAVDLNDYKATMKYYGLPE